MDIVKQRNLVIPLFLLQHYKDLKLEINEFIFLMYLAGFGNKCLFDPNKYASELNIELKDVMTYINSLSEKGFIQVDVMKNEKGLMEEVLVLDGFYSKFSLIVMGQVNNTPSSEKSSIFELIEKEFGRTLSPIEYEIIKAWLDDNISEELIKEALKEATYNGVSNLRYIDKILYEWEKDGIKNAKDVENRRKKRKSSKPNDDLIDMDIVDWNWFDEDE